MSAPAPASVEPIKKKAKEIEVGGRIYVLETVTKVDTDFAPWRDELQVDDARLQVDYRREDALKASLEADFAGNKVRLKDVYIRLQPRRGVRIQAGRFKRPISPIALESAWDLPQVKRGLLSDEVDTVNYEFPLRLGARSEGVQLELRPRVTFDPRFFVGVFNSELAEPRTELAPPLFDEDRVDLPRDLFTRAQFEPHEDLTLGGTFAMVQRVKSAGEIDHVMLASLDATYEQRYLRVWLEGYLTRTPYIDDFDTRARGFLVAGRVLVAGRIRRPLRWLREVEPFVGASSLELSTQLDRTHVTEVSAGVAAAPAKDLSLQLEAARTSDYALRAAVMRFYLQLGARF